MKKKILACILLASALLMSAGSVLHAQRIRSVDVHVYINADGDAYIKQIWDVNVVSGTEWYIPIGNLGGMSIRGLTVKENGEEFIDEGRTWDVDRSLSQKAGRSGIVVKNDGVEPCWGQGSYGDHVWEAGFVALGLVQSLEDCDAFNFMFVNPDLIAAPEHATVTFERLDDEVFSFDYTKFWFFGTEGKSELREDGTIFYETSGPMRRDDSIICMMRFDKGHFKPEIQKKMKFEKMQKKAFKGSTYKSGKSGFFSGLTFEDVVSLLVAGAFVLVIVGIALLFIYCLIRDAVLKITGHKWSKKVFGATKIRGWEREAPFGGSIPIAAHLLKDGSRLVLATTHTEWCIGAYFLRWIQEGVVTPVKAADGHFDLQFPEAEPDFRDDSEKSLYKKAFEAAGSNRILEKGEFDSWATSHYRSMAGWPDALVKEGKSKLSSSPANTVDEAAKLLKFKNYLNEFTLSREREVPEVSLWGQYLVYAQIFGIADKVASGFEKMYPKQFADYSQQYGLDSVTMRSVVHSWTNTANNAYSRAYNEKLSREAAARSSSSGSSGGYGGFSSRGGGGGFSGGGHGGGSR
ncbi:MAG: DUF2207 domain-containing protein [Bacteroidales bacterium]|nr:DUF2207 domain-containing protein [Bacteroidales bacterium]